MRWARLGAEFGLCGSVRGFVGVEYLGCFGLAFCKRGFLPVRACRALICSLPHIKRHTGPCKAKALHGLFFGVAWANDKANADNAG